MLPKKVKIYKAQENITPILKEAVNQAELQGKKKILIKPNLSHFEYLTGVVTSPDLTYELIGMLRDSAEEVIVAESEGFNYSCKKAFQKTGMEDAVKKAGGIVMNLSEDKVVKVKFPKGNPLSQLFLPKTVLDADAVIDLPMMKTHEFMLFTGAIKNLFGCVPSNRRIFLHPYLPEVLFRLYDIFKPQLTIMDARVGIEGNGPTKGVPVPMGLMLVGNDALATDVVATQIMKLDWKNTYLNYIAQKASFKQEEVLVQGLQVETVARRFELPRIDMPVKAQMEIYKSEFLTKLFFSSLPVVRMFQKVTKAYRGTPVEPA